MLKTGHSKSEIIWETVEDKEPLSYIKGKRFLAKIILQRSTQMGLREDLEA